MRRCRPGRAERAGPKKPRRQRGFPRRAPIRIVVLDQKEGGRTPVPPSRHRYGRPVSLPPPHQQQQHPPPQPPKPPNCEPNSIHVVVLGGGGGLEAVGDGFLLECFHPSFSSLHYELRAGWLRAGGQRRRAWLLQRSLVDAVSDGFHLASFPYLVFRLARRRS